MRVMHGLLMRVCAVGTAGVLLSTAVILGASASSGGSVTTYQAVISGPQDITAGPDGALWFTNFLGSSIGRITPAGQITFYSARGMIEPQGITAGPDGALWSTDYGSNSISRVSATFTPTISNSRTFAGYQTTVAAGSATSSAARFTVPKLSCTTATRAITPEAGVAVNNYKTSSFAFVITGCVNGKATYFPGLVVNGKETDYTNTPLSAGDVINLSARVTTSGTTVQVADVTKGVTKKLTGAGASANAAWIGDDAAVSGSTGKLLGVPKFGTLTFTNCLIDGGTLAVSLPHEYQRVNSTNTVTIATGSLSSTGTAFATNYKHF